MQEITGNQLTWYEDRQDMSSSKPGALIKNSTGEFAVCL